MPETLYALEPNGVWHVIGPAQAPEWAMQWSFVGLCGHQFHTERAIMSTRPREGAICLGCIGVEQRQNADEHKEGKPQEQQRLMGAEENP